MTPRVADLIRSIAASGEAFLVAGFVYLAMRIAEKAEAALEFEYARSEALLHSIMPYRIAARLKSEPQAIIADKYDQVTLLFADVVDFTPKACSPVVAFSQPDLLVLHALPRNMVWKRSRPSAMHGPRRTGRLAHQVATAADMALEMLDTVRSLQQRDR